MKKILLLIVCSTLWLPSYSEPNSEPYNPSWVGWLKLPKPKRTKAKKVPKSEKPKLWKQWKQEQLTPLSWLPRYQGTSVPTKNIFIFKLIKSSQKKSRRQRRHSF